MEGRDPARARRDPASVQAEIERTQARLVSNVDAIADRTNPRNAARRGLRQLRDAGGHLVEEARTLVGGGGAVRIDTEVVEAPEGSVRLKHDDEVVSTYSTRGQLPPEAVLIGVGVGVVVVVGLAVLWRRRRR
ncbi:DUF3618 domain-containing protein [Marinitenerispora sediminis]|uniref:DUF3618 domain-containing protein n=1 Tax=Marinitenerispora sediminis TaxID=1931232 RepID=A0A368T1K3_9ACTN|nr:DUF3618 domain-containing protein [Marinitenerispora sediminis]RCV48824.1 DUF3618 domain-containing protein [Marinitenerispora sediminis]RCV51137.1 DUF3618 domain-containing protein [Marinitenerispora sediminis]RCV54246.1 DUF3618 domain-containing protein [Marinitenerispora sediminis]